MSPRVFRKKERIAVVFWEGYLGIAPSLINAATSFADAGHAVDIYTRPQSDSFGEPPAFPESVSVRTQRKRPVEAAAGSRARVGYVLGRLSFLVFCIRNMLRRRPDWLIGVDTDGVLIASALGAIFRRPSCYWSLEIRPLEEPSTLRRRGLRRAKRSAYRRSAVVVTQDSHRQALLVAKQEIDPSRVVIVPNAPKGPSITKRSTFLRDRLGIPDDQRIVLHLGMISPMVLSAEVASTVASWPEGWMLVFHERAHRSLDDEYLQQVAAVGGGRVAFSLSPVPYELVDDVVASADIGIVCFDSSAGVNYSLPGSSGKIAQYLRCGLPIVCTEMPGVSDVVERYSCGRSVRWLEDLPAAIDSVAEGYSTFGRNAARCYEEVFEFGHHFSHLVTVMGLASGLDPEENPHP